MISASNFVWCFAFSMAVIMAPFAMRRLATCTNVDEFVRTSGVNFASKDLQFRQLRHLAAVRYCMEAVRASTTELPGWTVGDTRSTDLCALSSRPDEPSTTLDNSRFDVNQQRNQGPNNATLHALWTIKMRDSNLEIIIIIIIIWFIFWSIYFTYF